MSPAPTTPPHSALQRLFALNPCSLALPLPHRSPMRSGKTSATFRVHRLLRRLGIEVLVVKARSTHARSSPSQLVSLTLQFHHAHTRPSRQTREAQRARLGKAAAVLLLLTCSFLPDFLIFPFDLRQPDVDGRSLDGSQPDEVATRDPAHGGHKLKALVLPRDGLASLPSLLAARRTQASAPCVVVVDEIQFFESSEESVAGLSAAAARAPVVCAGLDFTSEREEWPLVAALRGLAAAVFTLCALAARLASPWPFTLCANLRRDNLPSARRSHHCPFPSDHTGSGHVRERRDCVRPSSHSCGLFCRRTARCEGCEGRAQFTFCTQEKNVSNTPPAPQRSYGGGALVSFLL